jgi:hypothetical protein
MPLTGALRPVRYWLSSAYQAGSFCTTNPAPPK